MPNDTVPEAGIIPAYAGSTAVQGGDALMAKGSSPHTRGAPIFAMVGISAM